MVSDVVPVGKNTYTVSAEKRHGIPSWVEIKHLALKQANEHCERLGKQMTAGKWDTHGVRGWGPISAELTFECIEK